MSSTTPSRRAVVSAAAWGTPAIALAGMAPAFAASPSENAKIKFTSNQVVTMQRPNTLLSNAIFYTTTYGGYFRSPTQSNQHYIRWSGTSTATTINDLQFTFYVTLPDIKFQNGPNHSSCWSALIRDASVSDVHSGGTTLHAYTARYTCPIVAKNGATEVEDFEWDSKEALRVNTSTLKYWARRFTYTLNGVQISSTGNP